MRNGKRLEKTIKPVIDKALREKEIKSEMIDNKEDRYELKLSKDGKGKEIRFLVNQKKGGRSVPLLTLNVIKKDKNLLYSEVKANYTEDVKEKLSEALKKAEESL